MKLIFLDVDGVLSSFGERGLCSTRLDMFAEVVKQTGAEVVLSSMWRMPHCREARMRLQQELGKREVELAGMTPVLDSPSTRGDEIQVYLNRYRQIKVEFVILDDDPNNEMGRLKPHLVKTDGHVGLTASNCEEMIQRLGVANAEPENLAALQDFSQSAWGSSTIV